MGKLSVNSKKRHDCLRELTERKHPYSRGVFVRTGCVVLYLARQLPVEIYTRIPDMYPIREIWVTY